MSNLAQPACQPSPSLNAAPEVHSPTESISWQDVFATTLYETQESDVRRVAAAATLPTPVFSSDAMLSSASVNQPTFTPTYQFSSSPVSDIIGSNFSPNEMSELATVRRVYRNSAPSLVRAWSSATADPHLAENESNLAGFSHEQTSVPLQGHDTLSDRWPEQDTVDRSGIPLAVFKDKNINLLSDLSAILMKDLHRITTYESASSFLLTHSDTTAAEYFVKTMDSTTSSDYIIEKMLHGTERFLEAVQSLHQPPLNHSCPNSEHSADAETDNLGESEGITDSSVTSLEARMEERWRFMQAVLNRATYVAGDDSTGNLPGRNESYKPQPKWDVPSTFALLTCYTCLIKIYESVFSIIYLSFEVSRKWTVFPKLPQTITGLRINGFVLQNHHDLQIKVLIQVSTYMLDSVEKALGGMLSSPLFQALLKSSLQQEGYISSSDNETGTKIVRDMMKKIEGLLLNGDR